MSAEKIIKLSASSIGTFEKCPKQYHYRYIEKPDVPKVEWDFQEYGKFAHRVLELFHLDLINNVRQTTEYSEVLSKSFKQSKTEFKNKVSLKDLIEIKSILQTYLNNTLTNGLPHVLSAEMDFNYHIDKYLVRGFIDRIDQLDEDEYRVVDYKTTKSPKYLTNFQLVLYALALKEKYPNAKIIHGSYLLLKHNCTTVDWTFTEKDYQDARDKVIRVGKSIDTSTIWEKKPSALCKFCDFNSICQDNWTEAEFGEE